jgi:tetratricopeptide (TPR) repeat protein
MRAPFAKSLSVVLAATLSIPTVAFAAPPPASPGADPASMTPEQKLERAKQLFGEGLAALEAGDNATALNRFEDAYNNYAPDKHKFNFNIGTSAYGVGDCVRARAAFQRFLDLVPDDPNRGDAQVKIMEIDRSGCANVAPTTTNPPLSTSTLPPEDEPEDAPILSSKRSEREENIERERDADDAKRKSPLMITGALLTGLGAAGIIGGAVSIALANKKANDLANLASPGATGFPEGDYADDEVFDLDRNKLPRNNVMTIVFFTAGGAMLATGIALLVVDGKRKKARKKGSDTAMRKVQLVGAGPSALPRGAGASATIRF